MANIEQVARSRDVSGIRRRFIGRYVGPVLYAAGGDALAASEVGMGVIEFIAFEPATDGTDAHHPVYDHATGKVLWFSGSTGAEVGAVDLSGFAARFEAVGR